MVSTQIHISFLLVLSFVALGNCEHPVACKTDEVVFKYLDDTTAGSWIYKNTSHISPDGPVTCIRRCRDYCVDKSPPNPQRWPNCKAFSSRVETGGTCTCYGWTTIPNWYHDSSYKAGWCEK